MYPRMAICARVSLGVRPATVRTSHTSKQFADYRLFVSHSADCHRFTPSQVRPIDSLVVVWQLPPYDGTMAQLPLDSSTYAEPTIMWRLRNSDDGRDAYSVIVPHGSKATAGWFSQGIPQESSDFATWRDAIRWLEAKLVTLQLHGWHVEASER